MAVKDWPLPVRRMIAYGILAVTVLVSFGPISLALWNGDIWTMGTVSQFVAGYAAIITGATTAIVAGSLYWGRRKRPRPKLGVHVIVGAVIGLIVGLLLIPITAGLSLLFGPPVGFITGLAGWTAGIGDRRRDWISEPKAPDDDL